ncbi:MAG: GNAT family N-acetyltransferase, partial [Bacteroidales bacterium]|nr:GNAT family N-acetyltransferase [Bacteroidales bacterium]
MQPIIPPVDKALLRAELTPDRRLRSTNKAGNEIYIVTYQQAPYVMREIGRLREIAFRAAGGGTGLELDWDEFDTCDHPYYQLIVWDPEEEQILGGYRFLPGKEIAYRPDGQPHLATGHMFHFSDEFIHTYMDDTVELGRSFVTLEYQSTRALSKGIFALDNLWDGLGALTVVIPDLKYFFGKMT